MDRIELKKEVINLSKELLSHGQISTPDAYSLAEKILDYFELERKETLSQLSGSVTESEIFGKITPGCKVNR